MKVRVGTHGFTSSGGALLQRLSSFELPLTSEQRPKILQRRRHRLTTMTSLPWEQFYITHTQRWGVTYKSCLAALCQAAYSALYVLSPFLPLLDWRSSARTHMGRLASVTGPNSRSWALVRTSLNSCSAASYFPCFRYADAYGEQEKMTLNTSYTPTIESI